MEKMKDYWFAWGLFLLFYLFGLSFLSFLGLFFLVLWFLKKKPLFWWFVLLMFLVNILVFRTLTLFLFFSLLFYLCSREKNRMLSVSGNFSFLQWPLILTFFVLVFDLYFFSTNFRFMLGASCFLFFLIMLFYCRYFFKNVSVISDLILSFVFSQLFFILYFLPFGNITNAGVMTISLLALVNYQKNHSLKQLLALMILCALLLFLSGIKPR